MESVYEGGIKLDDEKDTIGWGRGWYNNFTQVPEEIRAVSRPIFIRKNSVSTPSICIESVLDFRR